jgi:hypothetical protein
VWREARQRGASHTSDLLEYYLASLWLPLNVSRIQDNKSIINNKTLVKTRGNIVFGGNKTVLEHVFCNSSVCLKVHSPPRDIITAASTVTIVINKNEYRSCLVVTANARKYSAGTNAIKKATRSIINITGSFIPYYSNDLGKGPPLFGGPSDRRERT